VRGGGGREEVGRFFLDALGGFLRPRDGRSDESLRKLIKKMNTDRQKFKTCQQENNTYQGEDNTNRQEDITDPEENSKTQQGSQLTTHQKPVNINLPTQTNSQ
jgi:hypothetical protein